MLDIKRVVKRKNWLNNVTGGISYDFAYGVIFQRDGNKKWLSDRLLETGTVLIGPDVNPNTKHCNILQMVDAQSNPQVSRMHVCTKLIVDPDLYLYWEPAFVLLVSCAVSIPAVPVVLPQ